MPRWFCDESQRTVVGAGGFKTMPVSRRIEIGFGIAPSMRNRGFATRGVSLLIAEAFSSGAVDSIFAHVKTENLASRRVLEKAGFTFCRLTTDEEGPVELWSVNSPQDPLQAGALPPETNPRPRSFS
jgi:RimJ/RimL family protein N-acetyltransferase